MTQKKFPYRWKHSLPRRRRGVQTRVSECMKFCGWMGIELKDLEWLGVCLKGGGWQLPELN